MDNFNKVETAYGDISRALLDSFCCARTGNE